MSLKHFRLQRLSFVDSLGPEAATTLRRCHTGTSQGLELKKWLQR